MKRLVKGGCDLTSPCACVVSLGSGAIIASLVVVNVQQAISWTIGYIIPTAMFGLALALIIAGSALYVYVPPGGSAYKRIGQVPSPCDLISGS